MARAGSTSGGMPLGALQRTPATRGVAWPETATNMKAYSYDKHPESPLTRSDIGRWH
jgi:hypothetical protein